jgi:uncharacterized protein involved in exopolysaccharide biosynthesis
MAADASLPATPDRTASTSSSKGTDKSDDDMVLLDLLICIAERKNTALSIALAFAALSVVVSLLLPNRYTATVTIMPPQQHSSMDAALASQFANLGGMAALAGSSLGMKNPNDMLVGLMKSRTIEDAVVQHFGLMQEYKAHYLSEARKDLEEHATLDGNGKDGLIHISIEDRDPDRAAELANGYLNQFRDLSDHLAITEASQRRLFFERQLEDAKNNLTKAEVAMMQTEQKTGLIQLDSQARALIESAASLRAQIAAKEVQIKSLQTFATDQNAELVQAQQEMDSLKAELAKLGGSESNKDMSLILPRGKVPEASLEYIRKLRDVRYDETIFDILARQFELAKLDEAKQGALIQVVDLAIPPDRRSFPHRAIIVIVSTLLGFVVGTFFTLMQAGYQRMKDDTEAYAKLNFLLNLLRFRRRQIS